MRTVVVDELATARDRYGVSDAPILTPALRSSASFSGVLTFGPKVPHHAKRKTTGETTVNVFGSVVISNRG